MWRGRGWERGKILIEEMKYTVQHSYITPAQSTSKTGIFHSQRIPIQNTIPLIYQHCKTAFKMVWYGLGFVGAFWWFGFFSGFLHPILKKVALPFFVRRTTWGRRESPNLQSNLAYVGSSEDNYVAYNSYTNMRFLTCSMLILSPQVFRGEKGIIKLTEARVSSSGKEHQFVFTAQRSLQTRAAP